jgi:hypothetical protein
LEVISPVKALRNLWGSSIKRRLNPSRATSNSGIQGNPGKKNLFGKKADQPRVSPQSKEGLLISGIIQRMGDRQALLTEDLSKRIIRTEILTNIQKELIKDWNSPKSSKGSPSPQDQLTRITLDTARKIDLYDDTFEEGDLQFMLRIGWKLAEYHLGLTRELETDAQYLAIKEELIKQMALNPNEDINNVLTTYLNFSFAMNSGYIFSSYLSANPKMKRKLNTDLSPARIKEVRDTGLNALLSYIQTVIAEVSKSAE